MKKRLALLASAVLLALPLFASARDAFTVDDVSLKAGPDEEYPSITHLQAGSEVSLQGCIDGWSWCDVIAGDDRGWVPASYLEEEYNNQRVLVVDYGPRIGIPVVSFSVGAYWDRHYHNRPWYHERERWESRHIQPRALPRPTQARSGGAELRAHADVRSEQHHDEHARTGHDRDNAARTQQSSATTQQSSGAQLNAGAQTSSTSTTQSDQRNSATARHDNSQTQTQTAAQSDAHAAQNPPQREREGALGPARQMPPQVQTARNNNQTSSVQQSPQQHGEEHARDESHHDQGAHKGDAKDRDRDHDKDHDKDHD